MNTEGLEIARRSARHGASRVKRRDAGRDSPSRARSKRSSIWHRGCLWSMRFRGIWGGCPASNRTRGGPRCRPCWRRPAKAVKLSVIVPCFSEQLSILDPGVRVLRHARNQGKGAALRIGFREATGDFIAVQDADAEYNPLELRELLEPLRDG